ncbi:MAG: hypothetical protein HOQ05_09185 [Corynebacteriales bacterium]|nr:hypothetical protein [Mycobacteriales bacterium]
MIASNIVTGPLKFAETFAVDTLRTRRQTKGEDIDQQIETQKFINRGFDDIVKELTANTEELLRDEKAFNATAEWALSAGLLREVADGDIRGYELAVEGEHAAEMQEIWDAVQEFGLDDVRRHFLALFAASNKQPDRFRARLMALVSDYDDKLDVKKISSTVASTLRAQVSGIARELAEAHIRWNGIREHLPQDDLVAQVLRDVSPFEDVDVLDPEALRLARTINALPGADAGDRLAAIAVQAAGQLGGVSLGENSALQIDAMIAYLSHASRVIDSDVERVRHGQSLVVGREEALRHQRGAKAIARHISEQLAQSTDLDAPLSAHYGGDRAAYLKQTIESMATAQCQMSTSPVGPLAKISPEDGGGILDRDQVALRDVLCAQQESISLDHPDAHVQAAMNGQTIDDFREELAALLANDETSVSLKHLGDGSAMAAVSVKPFKWDSPGDNEGFLLRLCDVPDGQGYATEVSMQAKIVPAPLAESTGKLASLRRRIIPSRFRAPSPQLSSPAR